MRVSTPTTPIGAHRIVMLVSHDSVVVEGLQLQPGQVGQVDLAT